MLGGEPGNAGFSSAVQLGGVSKILGDFKGWLDFDTVKTREVGYSVTKNRLSVSDKIVR